MCLLLYPEFPDTFWSFKHALKFIHKKASLPPLGLLTVAAMLPGPGRKRLVDVNVRKLRERDLAWADLVLISGMIAQRDSARDVDRALPRGGQDDRGGRTAVHARARAVSRGDHFVLNEAEVTLPEFLRDFEQARRGACMRQRTSPTSARRRPVVGTGGLAALRFDEPAVLARLPVRLRVLQHHLHVRASAPHQDRRASDRGAGRSHGGGLARAVFFVDDNFIGNKRALKEDCCRR
jgi:radical SAM superfamily enzyme YgiQ (UPF0313 family)